MSRVRCLQWTAGATPNCRLQGWFHAAEARIFRYQPEADRRAGDRSAADSSGRRADRGSLGHGLGGRVSAGGGGRDVFLGAPGQKRRQEQRLVSAPDPAVHCPAIVDPVMENTWAGDRLDGSRRGAAAVCHRLRRSGVAVAGRVLRTSRAHANGSGFAQDLWPVHSRKLRYCCCRFRTLRQTVRTEARTAASLDNHRHDAVAYLGQRPVHCFDQPWRFPA